MILKSAIIPRSVIILRAHKVHHASRLLAFGIRMVLCAVDAGKQIYISQHRKHTCNRVMCIQTTTVHATRCALRVPSRRAVNRETVNTPDPGSLAGETTSEDCDVTMTAKDTPSKASEDDGAPVQTARVLV